MDSNEINNNESQEINTSNSSFSNKKNNGYNPNKPKNENKLEIPRRNGMLGVNNRPNNQEQNDNENADNNNNTKENTNNNQEENNNTEQKTNTKVKSKSSLLDKAKSANKFKNEVQENGIVETTEDKIKTAIKRKIMLFIVANAGTILVLFLLLMIPIFIIMGLFGDGSSSDYSSYYGSKYYGSRVINNCHTDAAEQVAKILFEEFGAETGKFFEKLNVAAVIVNNAKGDTYDKIYALNDNNYYAYSTYKDKSFEDVVPESKRGEMLYAAETVLSGKYRLPKNMTLQAAKNIVVEYGTIWTWTPSSPYDTYFGYEHSSLESEDFAGNKLPTEAYSSPESALEYYKNLATSLELDDYSKYTAKTVCKNVAQTCTFNIKSSTLTKAEFKNIMETYANNNSNNKNYVVFATYSDYIYDIATRYEINPEMVLVRAMVEGFSPGGTTNNYWGIGCTNEGGINACKKYITFQEGVEAYAKNISQYDSLTNMMSKYAYIGDYWYSTTQYSNGQINWGLGGCPYLESIKPYISSSRYQTVLKSCNEGKCSQSSKGSCLKTTSEDQEGYASYQVSKMEDTRGKVYGTIDKKACETKIYDSMNNINKNENIDTNLPTLDLTNAITSESMTDILRSDLKTFLKNHDTTIDEFNNYIYKSVKDAGLGTANGVAAAGFALTQYTTRYNVKLRYTLGGSYSGYGVKPNMGAEGMDCSMFVSWAIHNGGFKYKGQLSGDWGIAGSKCRRTDSNCVGKVGDLIWHEGHIMLIVGVKDGKYYIAHESCGDCGGHPERGGLKLVTGDIHKDMQSNEADYIVDMTNYYNTTEKVTDYPQ